MNSEEMKQDPDSSVVDKPTKDSDLSDTSRSIHIVTTASLPWLTGTAVNPLLRALYFQRSRTNSAKVTLVIPWVVKLEERQEIYPGNPFSDGKAGRKEQEACVRKWIEEKAGMVEESKSLRIQFYPATYQKKLGSILTLVDICSLIPEHEADVAILEEPEHLTWFAMPSKSNGDDFLPTSDIGWMGKFKHVVVSYLRDDICMAVITLGLICLLNVTVLLIRVSSIRTILNMPGLGLSWEVEPLHPKQSMLSVSLFADHIGEFVTKLCLSFYRSQAKVMHLTNPLSSHKIVKLSATLPVFAEYKECICNTHGVRSDFLREQSADDDTSGEDDVKVYFIGKILWAKGFNFMLECQEKYYEDAGEYFPIDIYGGGPELEQIKRAFFGVRGKLGEKKKDGVSTVDDALSPKHSVDESVDEADLDANTTGGKAAVDDDSDDHQNNVQSAYSQLSLMMLKAMPFLENEMDDADKSAQPEKTSTLKTIKDGIQLMRQFEKKTLLQKIPKSKYEWRKKPIPARFLGPRDHAALKFMPYKIFLNPSVTEVLCTTSAEALAMGKFVILPEHPSNEFFYQFPNCLAYKDMNEFVGHIKYAFEHDPVPLSDEMAHRFTWEAAMDRLTQAAAITESQYAELEKSGRLQRDKRKAWIHKESGRMIKGEALKSIVGEPPREDLKDYELDSDTEREGEGFMINFDNNNPKFLAFLSFIIAILSYFFQR